MSLTAVTASLAEAVSPFDIASAKKPIFQAVVEASARFGGGTAILVDRLFPTMPDDVPDQQQRNAFADAAKGMSIFLVVYWHTVGDQLHFNEALIFLRMPLFFFVSGLFAAKAMELDWSTFLKSKVGNTLYIFVLWTFLVFASTELLAGVASAQFSEIRYWQPFQLFLYPPQTLWFMYALAVSYAVARVVRSVPTWVLLVISSGLYCVDAFGGEWRDLPFYERLIRLFPFFILSVRCSGQIRYFAVRYNYLGVPALLVFVVGAWLVYGTDLDRVGPLTIVLSFIGVMGTLMTCSAFQSTSLVRLLSEIGKRSLFVYVMHRIVLYYAKDALAQLGYANPVSLSILAVAATVLCLWAGERILDRHWPWLFKAPWLIAPSTKRAVVAGA